MIVEMRSVDSMHTYSANPRRNDAGVDAVAASIREYGWRVPIVVDEANVILAGHTRYKAALKLGLREVPVHVAVGLSPEQSRAFRIADNQVSNLSAWDDDKLISELLALQQAGFDLDLTGFSSEELVDLIGSDQPEHPGDPEEILEAPAEPETQPGDIWLLGPHRLLCGDATNAADVARLLEGHQVDLLLTDPPYGVSYVGKTADQLTIDNDNLDDDAYRTFLTAAFGNAITHLRPGAGFYIWHADSRGLVVRQACHEAGMHIRQALVWVKNAMVLGRQDYQWKHEPCLYGWKEGAAHTWFGERDKTTVLEFDRPSRSTDHPTTKPIDLLRHLIANSCPKKGIILDVFGGSGSTLVAAEQEGRRACLLELDPRYCDVICRRYEQLTGKTAERIPAKDANSSLTLAQDAEIVPEANVEPTNDNRPRGRGRGAKKASDSGRGDRERRVEPIGDAEQNLDQVVGVEGT